jgi:hypothetical protein
MTDRWPVNPGAAISLSVCGLALIVGSHFGRTGIAAYRPELVHAGVMRALEPPGECPPVGQCALSPPPHLILEASYPRSVRLSQSAVVDVSLSYAPSLWGEGTPPSASPLGFDSLRAVLSAGATSVVPGDTITLGLSTTNTARWRWTVRPQEAGSHQMALSFPGAPRIVTEMLRASMADADTGWAVPRIIAVDTSFVRLGTPTLLRLEVSTALGISTWLHAALTGLGSLLQIPVLLTIGAAIQHRMNGSRGS